MSEVINFYAVGDNYGCFSNVSLHPIVLKAKTWPTSEYDFDAQKLAGTPDEEEVRQAKSPMIAARMGRNRAVSDFSGHRLQDDLTAVIVKVEGAG